MGQSNDKFLWQLLVLFLCSVSFQYDSTHPGYQKFPSWILSLKSIIKVINFFLLERTVTSQPTYQCSGKDSIKLILYIINQI